MSADDWLHSKLEIEHFHCYEYFNRWENYCCRNELKAICPVVRKLNVTDILIEDCNVYAVAQVSYIVRSWGRNLGTYLTQSIYFVQVINSDQGYAIYSLICISLFFRGHSTTRTLNFFKHVGSTYLKWNFRLEVCNNTYGKQIPFALHIAYQLTLSWKCILLLWSYITRKVI